MWNTLWGYSPNIENSSGIGENGLDLFSSILEQFSAAWEMVPRIDPVLTYSGTVFELFENSSGTLFCYSYGLNDVVVSLPIPELFKTYSGTVLNVMISEQPHDVSMKQCQTCAKT